MIPKTSSTMANDDGERETSFFDRRHGDVVIDALRGQRYSAASFCDVTLNVRGRTIGAHACVLAAVSPYFAEFFGSDLPRGYSQRCPQVIDIVVDGVDAVSADVLADAVEAVVEFIYSGYLRVSQATLARVAEIAGILRLESAVHFCEEVLSGKLCSNQLVIKDGKLTEKADAKVGAADDTLSKDLKSVAPSAETTKVVLSSSQTPPSKLLRPPTLVSVGTQVYAALLDNAASVLWRGSQQQTELVGLELDSREQLRSDRGKLNLFVSENRTDVATIKLKAQLPNDANNKPHRQSQRARRKPVKLSDSAESCLSSKKRITSEAVCQITGFSDIQRTADVTENIVDENYTAIETVKFDSLEKAKRKTVNAKANAEESDSGGKFQCSFCVFSTNNVRKISEHNREHQRANNVCYYCERRFGSPGELSVHVGADHADIKTNNMPFVCSSCPARFRTRAQLVSHMPKHSSSRPFICARCGASFKWRNALHDHAVTHTSRKEHLCDICGYATAHRGQLRSHRLVHTGGTMRCSWPDCDFRATRMQNLKYHLLTHTQEKPHQCEVCGQSFSLAKNLKRHMMSHVNSAAKHNCSRCSFSTLRYDKLKEHLHKQHKVGSAPERRVRITDLVNLDLAKTVEGSVSQPACQPAEHQSAAVSDAPVLGRPASYVVDVDINIESTCPEKEQSVAESSVLLVEPADFLLGSVQPLPVMTAPGGGHVTLAPDAVNIAGAGSRFS